MLNRFILASLLLTAGVAGGQDPTDEVYQDFRGKQFNDNVLRYEGKTASKHVRPEDAGLRITLPPKDGPKKPTGFVFRPVVRGDFTATVGYEVLKDAAPPKGKSVGFTAYLQIDGPTQDGVVFGRVRKAEGPPVYKLVQRVQTAPGKRETKRDEAFPAPPGSEAGSLRVSRRGPTLTLAAAPSGSTEFKDVTTLDVGTSDVKVFRITADPDDTDTPIDARVIDLRVQSQGFIATAGAAPAQADAPRRWFLSALLGGVLALALAVAVVGICVARLRRNRVPPPAPESAGEPVNKSSP